jgi:hypothetical protein
MAKNKKPLIIAKKIIRYAFLAILLILIAKVWIFYGTHKEQDQGFIEFYTAKKSYEWNRWNEELPQQALNQIADYNAMVQIVWLEVILAFIIMGLDYFIDPENHFVTQVKRWLESLNIE